MHIQKTKLLKVHIISLLMLQIIMMNVLSSQSPLHQIEHLKAAQAHIDATNDTEETCNPHHTEDCCKTETRHKHHICHCMLNFMAIYEDFHGLITLIPAEHITLEQNYHFFTLPNVVFRPPIC